MTLDDEGAGIVEVVGAERKGELRAWFEGRGCVREGICLWLLLHSALASGTNGELKYMAHQCPYRSANLEPRQKRR